MTRLERICAEVGLDPTLANGVLVFEYEEDRDNVLEAAEDAGVKVTPIGDRGLKEETK